MYGYFGIRLFFLGRIPPRNFKQPPKIKGTYGNEYLYYKKQDQKNLGTLLEPRSDTEERKRVQKGRKKDAKGRQRAQRGTKGHFENYFLDFLNVTLKLVCKYKNLQYSRDFFTLSPNTPYVCTEG